MARKLRYNDEEGGMVKAQLMKIENYAAKLNDMIHPDDEIEGWVQAKLAVVAAYMGDVKHYLDYELQQSFADGGGVGFKPRYWEVEFTWEGEAEGDGRKVNVMADSVAEAEQKVKDKFGMYYKGLKVVEVEEDKEMTWDEYAATKGVKKMADGGITRKEDKSWASEQIKEISDWYKERLKYAKNELEKVGYNENHQNYKRALATLEKVKDISEKIVKSGLLNNGAIGYKKSFKITRDGYADAAVLISNQIVWNEQKYRDDWYAYEKEYKDYYPDRTMFAAKIIGELTKPILGYPLSSSNAYSYNGSYIGMTFKEGGEVYSDGTAKKAQEFKMADGGMVKELEFNDTKWYLTYDDPTHFFLSNSRNFKGTPYHIGQFRGRPFYNEVNEWLKETSRQSKMADGGSIQKGDLVRLKKDKNITQVVDDVNRDWSEWEKVVNYTIAGKDKKGRNIYKQMADGGEVMVELKRRGFSNSEAERLVKKHDYLVDVADTAEEAANDIERYDDSENEFPDVPELKFSKGGDIITFPDGYQFKKVSKDFATKNWANKEIYGLDLESNTEALIENVKDLTRFEVFAEEVGFKEDGGDIEDERELREERREMMERRYEADREEAAIRQLEKRKVKLEDLMRHDDLYFIGNIYDSDTDGWVSKFEAQKIIDKVNAERLEDGGELGLKKNWVLKPVFVQLDKPSDIKLNRVRRQIEDYASQGFRSADILLKMAFITDEPKLLEDQFQKIKNSIYYQKDIKKYYRGGKMEDEFLKYEGSSFYDDFNEAKQYVGDAVWNDMSYDDKVQATKYLKATGKIGWFGEYEDLETVAASMYKRGGSVGKYLVAVNQKKTNIVSKMLVDSLSDIDRRQYEVLSVKKLG